MDRNCLCIKQVLCSLTIILGMSFQMYVCAQAPDWTVNHQDFEHNMIVTAVVMMNGIEVRNEDGMLAAFIGEECRGVAQTTYYESLNRYFVSLMIYGHNMDENKAICFKYYDAIGDVIVDLADTMEFDSDHNQGDFSNPYQFTNVNATGIALNGNDFGLTLYPNPFIDYIVLKSECVIRNARISIYSIHGKCMFKTMVMEQDELQLDLNYLPEGIYFLEIIDEKPNIKLYKLIKMS